jgi:1-acyl-sn-glycerol-3-phosphate acyltransferase
MAKDNIEKYSAGYAAVKPFAMLWHNYFFYRKVIVSGKENINPDHHLIFAPNHQNALMDALAVLFTSSGQPVFLARADIFRRKLIASVLYFLKMLPVFRIRDGFDSLRENDWVFRKTVDVIKNKSGLVILPEGNHSGQRKLRQLKKGICRIAFQAAADSEFTMEIRIIPVGLEFTNYTRMRQVLTVVYGKPIEVSGFYDSYKQNPQKAMNDLRDRLSYEMKNLMVHIESEDDYEAIDELRTIINGRFADDIVFPKLFRDRALIDNLNKLKSASYEKFKHICDLALKVKEGAIRHKTEYSLLEKEKHSAPTMLAGTVLLLLFLPVFIYGFLFNVIFLAIPVYSIRNNKDHHFHSSIKYTVSLLLAMLFLPVFLIFSLIFVKPVWMSLLVFLTVPLSGLFAWSYWMLFKRIAGGFRIRSLIRSGNNSFIDLRRQFDELLKLVKPLS